MSLPLFPCPKKFTFWDTTLLPRGTFWVRVPRRPARGRPKAVFLLLACCTQEEDAGPAAHRCASSCVQQASRRSFAACSPLEPRAGLPSVPMSKIVYFLGHGFSPEAAPKYPRRKTGECPPARLLLPGGLGTPIRKMYVRRGGFDFGNPAYALLFSLEIPAGQYLPCGDLGACGGGKFAGIPVTPYAPV